MSLAVLPTRTAGAAENMAVDFLLLQRYRDAGQARFRHYGWHRPAFTFGYSQKLAFVRAQLPPDATFDLCRRPTGGGVVDHRDDWTYALVIPRGHPAEEARATESYRLVHECLAAALQAQGIDAAVKTSCEKSADKNISTGACAPAGICFQRAELHDVVHTRSGAKIAGAAQKRNKRGLLFQGSLSRSAAGGDAVDWERFGEDFVAQLAAALQLEAQPTPWPEWDEAEVEALTEQYASPEWTEFR